jgi:hypothetical protein
MLKHQMKHPEFQSEQEVLELITESWDDLTFTKVQSVFWEWTECLPWVAGNNGECYPNERPQFKKWLNIEGNKAGGSGRFFPAISG